MVEPTVKETVNPDLEPGERVVEQEMGGAGFTVSYTRKVWAGDTLRSDQTFTWTYDPQNAYVEVGPPAKPLHVDRPGRHDDRARRRDHGAGEPLRAHPRAHGRHHRVRGLRRAPSLTPAAQAAGRPAAWKKSKPSARPSRPTRASVRGGTTGPAPAS